MDYVNSGFFLAYVYDKVNYFIADPSGQITLLAVENLSIWVSLFNFVSNLYSGQVAQLINEFVAMTKSLTIILLQKGTPFNRLWLEH
jgi:hypothetical protein